MKGIKAIIVVAALTVCTFAANALAVPTTTTLTGKFAVDNGFIAYISTNDGLTGTQFGAGNDWTTTYSFSTILTPYVTNYLHVYAYDQGGLAGFLGDFSLSGTNFVFSNNTQHLLTNVTDWKGNATGFGSAMGAVNNLGSNGVSPWGTRPGIGGANWIWVGDAYWNDYAYFTTAINPTQQPVPEPSTIVLLGAGLLAGGILRRKFKK